MNCRYYEIREELEKKYTHVTLLDVEDEDRPFECSVWNVNEEPETIKVFSGWEIQNLHYHLEVAKVTKIANIYSEKYELFKKLMLEGIIEMDHTLYKKTTLKKLKEIMEKTNK